MEPIKDSDTASAENDYSVVDVPDQTIFRNLYTPHIRLPEHNEQDIGRMYRQRREFDCTVFLDDDNAAAVADVTRVGWKGRLDYALDEYRTERLKYRATENEVHRDPNALLNVTISTVILLASGIYDIPKEYYLYTELYLMSIRDEFNDSPQNIEQLIKHLRFIRQTNNIDWTDEYAEEPPAGLLISKIPNRSRIPLPVHSTQRPVSREEFSKSSNVENEGVKEDEATGKGAEDEQP